MHVANSILITVCCNDYPTACLPVCFLIVIKSHNFVIAERLKARQLAIIPCFASCFASVYFLHCIHNMYIIHTHVYVLYTCCVYNAKNG